jgi:hypothetical protein
LSAARAATAQRVSLRSLLRSVLPLLAALVPAAVSAQAWLPDKGSFNTTFVFNDVLNREHWLPNGDTLDVGHTRSQTYALLANYGVTDKLMVSASLPYVVTQYWGPPSHGGRPGFNVDNGDEHGSFTDLRVGVHYQVLEQPFAFAPYVAYVMPVSDYYVRGHAAQGRGLHEVVLGFNVGKSLGEWLPGTYAQMRYSYGFVEELQGVKHDRSNLNLEIGTFFTPRWNLSLYGSWQFAHGGIDVPVPPSNPYFRNHDALAADEFFNAGLGTGFAVTPQLTAFLLYMHGFSGANGHRMNQGLTLGMSYGYRPRAEAVQADATEPSRRE